VPHPFTGRLIDGSEAADWLSAGIADFSGSISLCSAYLRAQALEAVLAARRPGLRGRVLVRWQLADLLAGASDLRAYEVAKAAGLQLWVRLDFHGKVFCVPDRGIVVGSANATLSGLGLRAQSNEEVCTLVPSAPGNLAHIERLFAGAVLVDDRLFGEIGAAVDAASRLEGLARSLEWNDVLLAKLQVLFPVEQLLASECLWSSPQLSPGGTIDVADLHDRELLGVSQISIKLDHAVCKLQQTKVFRWLRLHLERSGGEQYFGSLTAALHGSLLDDPTPYRHEVKTLLQNLLSWCEALPNAGVSVDRPRHSQRAQVRDASTGVAYEDSSTAAALPHRENAPPSLRPYKSRGPKREFGSRS
jgi:hypothetical protein